MNKKLAVAKILKTLDLKNHSDRIKLKDEKNKNKIICKKVKKDNK